MLNFLRFFENLFYNIGSFFGDWADSIDLAFHDELRTAIKDNTYISLKSADISIEKNSSERGYK